MTAGIVAAHYVAAAAGNTYTGSTLAATVTRTNASAGSFAAQTWTVTLPRAVQFQSYVCDIKVAGDYSFKIDGVTVATVTGVAAAATNVTFSPSVPVEMLEGAHTFQLTKGSSTTWYYKAATALTLTGTGNDYFGWDQWQEGGSGLLVPGTINFKPADNLLRSGVTATSLQSSGTFTAQTWDVTFDVGVTLYGILKRQLLSDATGYTLSIDGSAVSAAVPYTDASGGPLGIACSTPVSLSAGTHTFKVQGSASRKYGFVTGAATITGDTHTTGWSVWAESTGASPEGLLFYAL